MEKLRIRDAGAEDVPLVARCTAAAVGRYDFAGRPSEEQKRILAHLEEICARKDTLYSYRNARMAVVGGVPVGCLISYKGDDYARMRAATFASSGTPAGMADSDMETGPGEYYLDAMAVLPACRGCGIGKELMRDGIRKAALAGCGTVTLLVDKTHPRLKAYYATLGFRDGEEVRFFGDTYIRMILQAPKQTGPAENQ